MENPRRVNKECVYELWGQDEGTAYLYYGRFGRFSRIFLRLLWLIFIKEVTGFALYRIYTVRNKLSYYHLGTAKRIRILGTYPKTSVSAHKQVVKGK